ncbi:MAG: hypothetical protein V1924_07295, partial [Candidatus Bathyarchaeota archaeon]
MKETVYLFGAGVNQVVKNWDGLSPPLLSNFLNIAFKMKKYSNDYYLEKIEDVLLYIEHYFKKNIDDLKKEPFDFELLFTLLEKQALRASKEGKLKDFN